MAAEGGNPGWAEAAVAFIVGNLPEEAEGEWRDYASTAFQIGCEALVALGQADERPCGAVRRSEPHLPDLLPRWDDISVAVIWLALQQWKLSYRQMDGSLPPERQGGWVIRRLDEPPVPAPNILGGIGTGPALATPEVLLVLEAMGLVSGGQWTAAAETVLWRGVPRAWGLDVTKDARFVAAVAQAVATVPPEVAHEMARLVKISAADVADAVAQAKASVDEWRAKFGPKAQIGAASTPDAARRSLMFVRQSDLDWLFFRQWRLGEGWLSPEQATRTLSIFHDSLAIQMRRAVMAQLYPAIGFVSEG